jgi:hypothetical protein
MVIERFFRKRAIIYRNTSNSFIEWVLNFPPSEHTNEELRLISF